MFAWLEATEKWGRFGERHEGGEKRGHTVRGQEENGSTEELKQKRSPDGERGSSKRKLQKRDGMKRIEGGESIEE